MSLIDRMPPVRSLAAEELLASVGWALGRGHAEFFEVKQSASGRVLSLTVRVRLPAEHRCAAVYVEGDVG